MVSGSRKTDVACGQTGTPTLVVVYHISQVVTPAIVGLAHAHGVVRKVNIAVVACSVVRDICTVAEPGSTYRRLEDN